jgi:hypothetical protein
MRFYRSLQRLKNAVGCPASQSVASFLAPRISLLGQDLRGYFSNRFSCLFTQVYAVFVRVTAFRPKGLVEAGVLLFKYSHGFDRNIPYPHSIRTAEARRR